MVNQTPVQIASVPPGPDTTQGRPGGVRRAGVGVSYLEIAYIPPEIRAFFEYVKQEQQ